MLGLHPRAKATQGPTGTLLSDRALCKSSCENFRPSNACTSGIRTGSSALALGAPTRVASRAKREENFSHEAPLPGLPTERALWPQMTSRTTRETEEDPGGDQFTTRFRRLQDVLHNSRHRYPNLSRRQRMLSAVKQEGLVKRQFSQFPTFSYVRYNKEDATLSVTEKALHEKHFDNVYDAILHHMYLVRRSDPMVAAAEVSSLKEDIRTALFEIK